MLHYRAIFSHNVMLSRNVMLSCQALSRSAQVVSQRTSGVAAARRNLGTSIGLTKNSLLQSNNENFVIKLALNYDKRNC